MNEPAKNQRGLCEVNGIVLSNMSRYLLARHPETLSKYDLKRAKKHLKECPICRDKIAQEKQKVK